MSRQRDEKGRFTTVEPEADPDASTTQDESVSQPPAPTPEEAQQAARELAEMLGVTALAEAVNQNRETLNQLMSRPEYNPAAALDSIFEKYPMFKSLAEEILKEIPGILKGFAGGTPVSQEFIKHYEDSQRAYIERRKRMMDEIEEAIASGKELVIRERE